MDKAMRKDIRRGYFVNSLDRLRTYVGTPVMEEAALDVTKTVEQIERALRA